MARTQSCKKSKSKKAGNSKISTHTKPRALSQATLDCHKLSGYLLTALSSSSLELPEEQSKTLHGAECYIVKDGQNGHVVVNGISYPTSSSAEDSENSRDTVGKKRRRGAASAASSSIINHLDRLTTHNGVRVRGHVVKVVQGANSIEMVILFDVYLVPNLWKKGIADTSAVTHLSCDWKRRKKFLESPNQELESLMNESIGECNVLGCNLHKYTSPEKKRKYDLHEVFKCLSHHDIMEAFIDDLVQLSQSINSSKDGIEELLSLSRECAAMLPCEFQQQCERVVQGLDDKRQELSVGLLKQLYTRMLFILTRCTRLLQFQTENGLNKDGCLKVVEKRMPSEEENIRDKAPDEHDICWENLKVNVSKSGDKQIETSENIPSSTNDKDGKRFEVANNQTLSGDDNRLVCRICEVCVPTASLEEHSRVCAIADRCDYERLCLDDRLNRLADTLEKIMDPHSPKGFHAACTTELSDSSSRHRKLEDMTEEPNINVDGIWAFSCKPRAGLHYNPNLTTSSAGSLTPRMDDAEDLMQIEELANIARYVARMSVQEEEVLDHLNISIQNLESLLEDSKADTITAYGERIKKLVREKYVQASDLELQVTKNPSSNSSTLACKNRTSIEDFEILKPISRGAFGRVFLARKKTTGDFFAIKVLRKADMIRKNAVKSVEAERNILISARNPFVVRFYYSFTCSENLYLVMEYLNGGDLYSLLMNLGCLEENMARTYIAELVLALEYLHSLGVVHRDLKPDNILIAHDGHIKLTDFGLSTVGLISSTDDLAVYLDKNQRSAVGTPDYLAPEILLGTGHDHTADWWSVGIILYEFITGAPPFNAAQPQVIFDNILNRKIFWPEEMSFEAYDLINKLLVEDPTQRLGYKGAEQVKAHPFFKNIKWDMLAKQKAAFVPCPNDHHDTSYFNCRHIDEHSQHSSCCSSGSIDYKQEVCDDRHELAEFETSSSNYTFNNFSFKNLSQLACMNYDLLLQNCGVVK